MPVKVQELLSTNVTTFMVTQSYREFVAFVREGFESSGFVNQWPSGSVDTSSCFPRTTYHSNYDVFAFNDALQATHPLYVKIYYTSGAAMGQGASAQAFLLVFNIGELYNSESAAVGSRSGLTWYQTGPKSAGTLLSSGSCFYAGESGSRICIGYMTNINSIVLPWWFNLSRRIDANGDYTGSGAVFMCGASSGSAITSRTTGYGIVDTTDPTNFTSYVGKLVRDHGLPVMLSSTTGSRPSISPVFVAGTSGKLEPFGYDIYVTTNSESLFPLVSPSDITGSQYTIQSYGVNHNYILCPTNFGGSGGFSNTSYTNFYDRPATGQEYRLLIRYE
jgi:hypothetical protein